MLADHRSRRGVMFLSTPFMQRIRSTLARHDMIRPGQCVVVAVSGGPDSVCLLDVLMTLREDLSCSLVVAHFNHGLRPGQDEWETRFVARLAAERGLPFEAGGAMLEQGGGLEARAREARYRFLEEARRRHEAHRIALGHHLDDQAETVLMRLIRGSGLAGLGGIPPVRPPYIIRPLLEVSRGEILEHLRRRNMEACQDPSNQSLRHLRNRIRWEVMPLLAGYQPQVARVLGAAAEQFREEEAWLESLAAAWLRRHGCKAGPGFSLPLRPMRRLPPVMQQRIVRHVLAKTGGLLGIGRKHLAAVTRLCSATGPHGCVDLPRGRVACRSYDWLRIAPRASLTAAPFAYTINGPGVHALPALGALLEVRELPAGPGLPERGSPWTACVDADKIRYPLTVRNFRPGDRFVPLGMQGRKKLKDFFIDLKVPAAERALVPLVLDPRGIVWVAGYRIEHRSRVAGDTRRVVKLTLRKQESRGPENG